MGQMTNKMDKVRALVYESPAEKFSIREVAKRTGVPKSTAQIYLRRIEKEKQNAELFKIRKIHYYIENLFDSGLIAYLEAELMPSCIILFGSVRKGESEKGSDIDLFIETTSKKTANISQFEKKLKHKINLMVEPDIKKLPELLRNNVINGIKLLGVFRI